MPLLNIIITLVLVGVALWAINRFIPMAASVKKILNIIVVVVLCIWLLQVFGIIDGSSISIN
ncbi:MAG: Thivi_2564 family membrane protein [Kiritimatiellia bacterium]